MRNQLPFKLFLEIAILASPLKKVLLSLSECTTVAPNMPLDNGNWWVQTIRVRQLKFMWVSLRLILVWQLLKNKPLSLPRCQPKSSSRLERLKCLSVAPLPLLSKMKLAVQLLPSTTRPPHTSATHLNMERIKNMAPHFTSGKFQTVQSPPMAKITSAALVLTGRLLLVVPQPPALMEIAIVANLGKPDQYWTLILLHFS